MCGTAGPGTRLYVSITTACRSVLLAHRIKTWPQTFLVAMSALRVMAVSIVYHQSCLCVRLRPGCTLILVVMSALRLPAVDVYFKYYESMAERMLDHTMLTENCWHCSFFMDHFPCLTL